MKIEVSSIFYDALEARYRADIVEAIATLEVYFKVPVGIGEHSELLQEHNKWVEKLANAEDKLAALREHFQQVQPDGSSEQDSSKKGDQ